ncbi:hypothetical protein [Jiella sp. M17.18]|uniref:hypothetical protein n=1 Tax=Jiella sp. M17.18 TaxID=3234247 RepID=UPI0034E00281
MAGTIFRRSGRSLRKSAISDARRAHPLYKAGTMLDGWRERFGRPEKRGRQMIIATLICGTVSLIVGDGLIIGAGTL